MSVTVMANVWEYAPVKGGALVVLLALADFADDSGTNAFPSLETLAKKCRFTVRNTQILIQALAEKGYLKVEVGGGRNNANNYTLPRFGPERVKSFPERVKSFPTEPAERVKNPDTEFPERVKNPDTEFHPIRHDPLDPSGTINDPSVNNNGNYSNNNLSNKWAEVLKEVEGKVSLSVFTAYLVDTSIVRLTEGALVVSVPTDRNRDYLERRLSFLLTRVSCRVFGKDFTILYEVHPP